MTHHAPRDTPSVGSTRVDSTRVVSAGSVDVAVGTRSVPAAILALTTVPAVDYADTFTLFTDVQATPEEWARAMFGDVPTLTERLIWRGLLGLRLAPQPSPANVAGWQVRARKLGSITLEAESSIVVGNLVVLTAGGQVSLGTFLHYRRRLGTCIWSPLSVVHRRLAPGLLRDAEATIRASR